MRSQSFRIMMQSWIFGLSLFLFVPTLRGQTQYTFTKIVETGTVGSNGQSIVLCSHNVPTTINDSGTVAFHVGNGGGIGLCQSGLGLQWDWTGNGSTPQLIYPLDGQGVNGLGPGAIIQSGDVAFLTRNPSAIGPENGVNLFFGNGGTPTLIASGAFSGSFVSANDKGATAVLKSPITVLDSPQILRFDTPGSPPTVIAEGTPAFNPPNSINQTGEVVFTKIDASTFKTSQVLKGSGGSLTTIAEAGMTVNGITFDSFDQFVSIRDDGWVAFSGLQYPVFQNGIYVGDGTQINRIVDTQDPSPFGRIFNPSLNNNGQIAFWGDFKPGSEPCPGGGCNGIFVGPNPLRQSDSIRRHNRWHDCRCC